MVEIISKDKEVVLVPGFLIQFRCIILPVLSHTLNRTVCVIGCQRFETDVVQGDILTIIVGHKVHNIIL